MNNYHDKFDAILGKNIDENTRKLYLAEINANPAIRAEFESYQEVFKLANIMERRTIKEGIEAIYNDSSTNTNTPKAWKRIIGIIIAILTLLAVMYMLNSKSEPIDPPQLAAKYFTAYPDKITSMGENEINLSAYNRQKYGEALIELEGSTGYEASFYRAICHLALNDYAKAEKSLLDIKSEIPQSYTQALEWYLALAKIGNNKSEEALPILDSFANNPNSDYQKDAARELIKMLR